MIGNRYFLFFDEDESRTAARPVVVSAPHGARPGGLWWLDKTLTVPKPTTPPEIKKLAERPQPVVVRAAGRLVLPVMGLRGSGRVRRLMANGGGKVSIEAVTLAGGPRAIACGRASAMLPLQDAALVGSCYLDEPDRGLAAVLGLEHVEDFR